jgi:hypothetical protein
MFGCELKDERLALAFSPRSSLKSQTRAQHSAEKKRAVEAVWNGTRCRIKEDVRRTLRLIAAQNQGRFKGTDGLRRNEGSFESWCQANSPPKDRKLAVLNSRAHSLYH